MIKASELEQLPRSGMLKRALNWLDGEVAKQNMYHALEASVRTNHQKFLSLCMPVEVSDPLAVLEFTQDDASFDYYWERPNDKFCIAAQGSIEHFKAQGIQRFEETQQWINEIKTHHFRASMVRHRMANMAILGGFGFFDHTNADEWAHFGATHFVIPEWMLLKDGQLRLLILNIAVCSDKFENLQALYEHVKAQMIDRYGMIEAHRKQMRAFREEEQTIEPDQSVLSYAQNDKEQQALWNHQIEKAKLMIERGYFEKIVLAKKVSMECDHDIRLTRVANALRRTYPECTTYFIRFGAEQALIGSTPEILAHFRPNYILTEALAGTIKRGKTATEDAVYEQKLLDSEKDLSEHNYVVDAIKHQLSRFVQQVDVAKEPTIKKLSNVQHLYTPITAWKDRPVSIMSVLHSMHPTPAVGGSPNGKAVKYIREFENFERGWYAAPIGWMNLSDEADFHVAIRSALIDGKKAFLYAGCGIVSDSDAELEWKEANLKLLPILTALRDA